METLLLYLQNGTTYIVALTILLGLLIFVHELGHFLVAKFFKVRVETFSLGFGKKIVQYTHGETTYCLSMIPLGGYVKMYGDDPSAVIPKEEQAVSFLHKPVGQRIAIVLAGPLMNLFFAIVLFFFIGLIGTKTPGPQIGDVEVGSPAYEAGFRDGDTIIKISGTPVSQWSDINNIVSENARKQLQFIVKREGQEQPIEITAQPVLQRNDDVFSWQQEVGKINGLSLSSTAALVGLISPESFAGRQGFGPLELVKSINGKEIRFLRELKSELSQALAQGKPFNIELQAYHISEEQPARTITLDPAQLPPTLNGKDLANLTLEDLGLQRSDLFLLAIKPDSPAEKAGLQRGDRIVSINGKKITDWKQVVEQVKSFEQGASDIQFVVSRQGAEQTFEIQPELTNQMNQRHQEEQRFTVGIVPAIASTIAEPVEVRHTNPLAALGYGVERTVHWTNVTVVSLVRLVKNEVSPKNIAGIITIGKVAQQSFMVGLDSFLKVMAIISINLFLINLLPIPILDGGHLVFFTIEALQGSPLSLRKMEIAQQVGMIILITLMAFALFNDITNVVLSPW